MLEGIPTSLSFRYAYCEPGDPPEIEEGQTVVLGCDEPLPKRVAVVIEVSEPGWGFGEVTIVQTPEGLVVDAETCGAERVKRWLSALVDKAIFDTDRDPERHALYNKIRRAYCGPRCEVCFPNDVPSSNDDEGEER